MGCVVWYHLRQSIRYGGGGVLEVEGKERHTPTGPRLHKINVQNQQRFSETQNNSHSHSSPPSREPRENSHL